MIEEVLSTFVSENETGLFSKDSQGARLKITVSSRESFEANLGQREDEEFPYLGRLCIRPAWKILGKGLENARIIVPGSRQQKKAKVREPFRARLISAHHVDVSVGVRFLKDQE